MVFNRGPFNICRVTLVTLGLNNNNNNNNDNNTHLVMRHHVRYVREHSPFLGRIAGTIFLLPSVTPRYLFMNSV